MTKAEAEQEFTSGKDPEVIKAALLRELKKGNPQVFEVVADRAYGKLLQKVEILQFPPGDARRYSSVAG